MWRFCQNQYSRSQALFPIPHLCPPLLGRLPTCVFSSWEGKQMSLPRNNPRCQNPELNIIFYQASPPHLGLYSHTF